MGEQPIQRPALSDDHLAARRKARQELEWLTDVDSAARHLDHLLALGDAGLPRPTVLLADIERRMQSLRDRTDGYLPGRQRPKQRWDRWATERPRALVSIDETGLSKGHDPAAPYFAVAAVIIDGEDIVAVDAGINEWKRRHLDTTRYIHELDIRKRTGAFYLANNADAQESAIEDLRNLLSALPYTATAVVIDKEQFTQNHPSGRVDDMLPTRLYPLAINMLFERVVHCLWTRGDRKGDLEAEGIGEVEDAHLQQAVATLKLRGTRFQSERWFRYQLADHASFHGKVHVRPGLQLADWIVKACADAARAARDSSFRTAGGTVPHEMWEAIRGRLYDGQQGREDTFGIKVYPSLAPDERLWLFPWASVDQLASWEPR